MTSAPLLPFGVHQLARAEDPDTSKDAAAAAGEVRNRHSRIILATLRRGESLTAEEIGERTGLSSVQVCRRWAELRAARLVEKDGKGRNRDGRAADRYRLRDGSHHKTESMR